MPSSSSTARSAWSRWSRVTASGVQTSVADSGSGGFSGVGDSILTGLAALRESSSSRQARSKALPACAVGVLTGSLSDRRALLQATTVPARYEPRADGAVRRTAG